MGYRMIVYSVVAPLLVFPLFLHAGPITFSEGGYDGVVVSIADNVPAHDCRNVLDKLEVSLVLCNSSLWEEEVLLVRGAGVLYPRAVNLSECEVRSLCLLFGYGDSNPQGHAVSFAPRSIYSRGKRPRCPLNRGVGAGLEALERTVCCDSRESARSVVATPTEP
jgi:hypothetical protein